jgi:hypothetical protein
MALIIFVFVIVRRFATSLYGMYYSSKSLNIDIYGQSGCRRYSSIIGGIPEDTDFGNSETHMEVVTE